jgi:glucokinase
MDDDANCAAVAESSVGAGRTASVVLLVVAGTGVGGGLVIDNRIYRGAHAAAGEIGHVALQADGPRCSCGSFGCVEAFASGRALAERGRGAMVRQEAPVLAQLAGNRLENVTAELVADAAQRGDPGAAAAIISTGRALGLGVAAAVSLLDPEIVVLAGGVGLLPPVVETVRETVRHRCIAPLNQMVRVEPAQLGDRAGVVGAALLAGEAVRD